jgi:hypothetical protein
MSYRSPLYKHIGTYMDMQSKENSFSGKLTGTIRLAITRVLSLLLNLPSIRDKEGTWHMLSAHNPCAIRKPSSITMLTFSFGKLVALEAVQVKASISRKLSTG